MRTTWTAFFSILFVVMLGTVGCDDSEALPTSAISATGTEESIDRPDVAYKFFTGRDSFGVAMKIQSVGTVETATNRRCGSDLTVTLSGTGTATHLGRIEGLLSHCATPGDLSTFYDGEFVFTGAEGAKITGSYPSVPVIEVLRKNGRTEEVVIETKAEINGGDIDAVQREQTEGRGDLRIALDSGENYRLTFNGWLLHHLAVD